MKNMTQLVDVKKENIFSQGGSVSGTVPFVRQCRTEDQYNGNRRIESADKRRFKIPSKPGLRLEYRT